MTIVELLTKHGLDPQPTSGGKELMMPCPLCQDGKARLYVNATTGMWICFRCEERGGTYSLCRKMFELGHFETMHELNQLDATERNDFRLMQDAGSMVGVKVVQAGIDLPIEYHPLEDPHSPVEMYFWRYLEGVRHLDEHQIREYNMGYCLSGTYAARLIIPVDGDGVLWTFVARAVDPKLEPKVRQADGGQPSRVLFNLDRIPQGVESIILVEGEFDAIALGRRAAATLGTNISPHHRMLLHKRGIKHIILLYDGDQAGREGAIRALHPLSAAGFKVEVALLRPGEDPASASGCAVTQAIERAISIDTTYLSERLISNRLDRHARQR